MNVTFFTAASDLPQQFNNYAFWFLIPIVVIACVIIYLNDKADKVKYSQMWLSSLTVFASWILVGGILFYSNDSNFTSDWINSAVAIGTIALAIFGWIAFKTGKDAYVEQKTLDRASFATIEIVKQILLPIYSLFNTLTIANQKLASCQIAFDADIENCSITSGTIAEYRAVIPLLESAIATVDLFKSKEDQYKVELAMIEAMYKSIKLDAANVIQLSSDLSGFIKKLEEHKIIFITKKSKLDDFCSSSNVGHQNLFRNDLPISFISEYINSLPEKILNIQ